MRILLVLALAIVLALSACTPKIEITSFDDCIAAGNPAMESYPRQCRANGQTFVDEISAPIMTLCGGERHEACTLEYNPVCAFEDKGVRCVTAPCRSFDAVNAGNACSACGDEAVTGYYPGSCEDNRFVVCDSVNGFDVAGMAADNSWICVDVCPGNFDSYTTQIGAQMCIQHYGVGEISQWETCTSSAESCDCVKAYETTDGEYVENPEFRCVPAQYAERLLFRGGKERLDESDQASVAVA